MSGDEVAEEVEGATSSASMSASNTPRPASRYTTKRPHRKSRAGCVLCKRRKIKCDEQHPQCTPCQKRKFQCSFAPIYEPETLIPTPSNALIPTNGLNSTDLRLMHHFATHTAASLATNRPGMETLLRNEIPTLAFRHDYLMHCILSISSLHLSTISPSSTLMDRKAVVVHHVSALSGFRRAIGSVNSSNAEAILITSLFLLIIGAIESSLTGDGEQWITSWLGLHNGIRTIIDTVNWQMVQALSVGPVFTRGKEPSVVPVRLPLCLWTLLGSLDIDDPDSQTLSNTLLALGALFTILIEEGCDSSELFLKCSSWAVSLHREFSALVRQMRPEALIIMAYYLSLCKLAFRSKWWMDGVSDKGIAAIANVLNGRCVELMKVPLQVATVPLTDGETMLGLLLGQLPEEHATKAWPDLFWEMPTPPPTGMNFAIRPPRLGHEPG